jgi:hypothetical protein
MMAGIQADLAITTNSEQRHAAFTNVLSSSAFYEKLLAFVFPVFRSPPLPGSDRKTRF